MASSCNSAIIAEIVRGRHMESCHLGHAVVADADGQVLFAVGNHERPIFPRSALKPLQALAGVMSGTDQQFQFTDAELAVICGSHRGEPRHRAAVRSILEKIEATEEQLHCGAPAVVDVATRDELIRAGQSPTAIDNNCSGKHAGMLALAKVLGASMDGYWNIDHPVQQKIQRICREMCGIDGASRLESSVSAARCVASMVQAGSNAPLMAVLFRHTCSHCASWRKDLRACVPGNTSNKPMGMPVVAY